jgi:hypothetical protein
MADSFSEQIIQLVVPSAGQFAVSLEMLLNQFTLSLGLHPIFLPEEVSCFLGRIEFIGKPSPDVFHPLD